IFALHKPKEALKDLPESKQFTYLDNEKTKVYLVNYDMVQADIMMISKASNFDVKLMAYSRLFNEFYGSGLSSIVFQEIRESKGLAYSAYASYTTPNKQYKPHYLNAFVGSQPDKLKDAVTEMTALLNKMPQAEKQFELAKESILRKLETERLI